MKKENTVPEYAFKGLDYSEVERRVAAMYSSRAENHHGAGTAINREMQHYYDLPPRVHFISRRRFTEFSWKEGDIILFDDEPFNYQPDAWYVKGNEWVRIDWSTATNPQKIGVSLAKQSKNYFVRYLYLPSGDSEKNAHAFRFGGIVLPGN